LTGQGWTQDELGNWYKVGANGAYSFIGSDGKTYNYDTTKGGFVDALGKLAGGTTAKNLGTSLKKLFQNKDGGLDIAKLIPMLGGLYGASKSNNQTQPSGYQGKIPKYTATRQAPGIGQLLSGNVTYAKPDGAVVNPNSLAPSTGVAPPNIGGIADVGQKTNVNPYANDPEYIRLVNARNAVRGGGGGIQTMDYKPEDQALDEYMHSKNPTFRADKESAMGQAVNQARLAVLSPQQQQQVIPAGNAAMAKGGSLQSGGFVFPADVVSHLGNGSSAAGLQLLKQRMGATPIKGRGDGMSDSIKTTIDGRQPARVANEEARLTKAQVQAAGGAQKLYAMMDKIRQARTGSKEQGKQINPGKYMPGGTYKAAAGGAVPSYVAGGATTVPAGTMGTESSLSNWAGDYVTDMLGKGQALSEMPYEQYKGALTSGPSTLQSQAFGTAANLQTPAAIGQAANTAGGIATAAQNLNYSPTQFGNQFTAPTQSSATDFTNQYQSPTAYQAGQFSSGTFGNDQAQQYMNPYLKAALDPQMAELQRQNQIANMGANSKMTGAGAFGGGRQAIMNTENQRNMMQQMNTTLGQGYNTAYNNAMSQFNADQQRQQAAQSATEQSRQFGASQAATAAQLQAQYGLSAQQAQEAARQFGQNQAMTGAQAGAQYGLAGQQATEASRQFGSTFGLQGLQTGLQAAQAQGQLGSQQSQADLANLNAQAGLGATQQGLEQADIAAQRAAFEEARLNPFKMVQFQQSLLSGLPLTAQTYNQAPTNNLTQFSDAAITLDKLLKNLGQ
jgi:hypothetical protein